MGKKQLGLFTFLFLIAGPMAEAQQPVKVYKIGLLFCFGLLPSSIEAFRQGLREFGYLEGQNIAVEIPRLRTLQACGPRRRTGPTQGRCYCYELNGTDPCRQKNNQDNSDCLC